MIFICKKDLLPEFPVENELQTTKIWVFISCKILNCPTIWIILTPLRPTPAKNEREKGERTSNASKDVRSGFSYLVVIRLSNIPRCPWLSQDRSFTPLSRTLSTDKQDKNIEDNLEIETFPTRQDTNKWINLSLKHTNTCSHTALYEAILIKN